MGSSPAPAVGLVLVMVLAGCLAGVGPGSVDDAGTPTPGPGTVATVEEVVDGDTVRIAYPNGSTDTVRLLGVDTPETRASENPDEYEGVPDSPAGRSCLREWGERATDFATETLEGRRVRIATDPESPNRGYYDRLLAYVYVDGESFNYRLVAEGYARVFRSEFSQLEGYLAAEKAARGNATGLWTCATELSTRTPVPEGSVVIAAVNADAAGDDNENLDDEYVVVENAGDEPVEIGGWTLRDEAGHVYTVPAGLVLDPGESVTIHTGSGENTDTDLYWGRGSAVWNNDGDTVVLGDREGRTVDREEY